MQSVRLAVVVAFLAGSGLYAAPNWRPVDPADLALKEAKIEKGADAEALFWDVRVTDELEDGSFRSVFDHYVRIKIFTERGAEAHAKVDLASSRGKIGGVAARTIKPDASVVEVEKDAIFDRDVVRAGGARLKAKSFALPGVVPGAIVEYRWQETRQFVSLVTILDFQREVPIQEVLYHIKPLSTRGLGMGILSFHCAGMKPVKEIGRLPRAQSVWRASLPPGARHAAGIPDAFLGLAQLHDARQPSPREVLAGTRQGGIPGVQAADEGG